MAEKDTGGLAFPSTEEVVEAAADHRITKILSGGGMTMRQYYAAAALQGLLANPFIHQELMKRSEINIHRYMCGAAFQFADSMILEGKS